MSTKNANTLIAKGLYKQYGSRMVVNNVDISVNRNEVVGLLGPNGAGKTTTFYMITGMIKPTKGDIFLDDYNITNDPMYRRARKGVGYLAQEPSIFSKLTVENNFILLDEPFAGVDPIAVEEIQSIVNSLKKRNIGVLITDHNVRETLSITDRSYLLFNGQILKSGSSEFLANDEEAKRIYLGEKFKLD